MKRIIITLSLLFCTAASFAQTQDYIASLMTARKLTCEDIVYNSMALIPVLHQKETMDTLNQLLIYDVTKCPYTNELIHFSLLYSIEQDRFNEATLHVTNLAFFIDDYRKYFDTTSNKSLYHQLNHTVIGDKYYTFLKEFATSLKGRLNLTSKEQMVVDFYAGPTNENYNKLATTFKSGTYYYPPNNNNKATYNSKSGMHYAAFAGLWTPTGKLSIVGNHPYVGVQIGASGKKLLIDLTLGIKFINSPNMYYINKADSIFNSTHFFGGYLGIDAAYNIFSYKKHAIDLLGGFGWDGFDALDVEQKLSDDRIQKTISSFNFNAGLGYKLFVNGRGTYLGFDAKYNYLLNLSKNSNGTDFSGNAFTLTVAIGGFSGSNWRNR